MLERQSQYLIASVVGVLLLIAAAALLYNARPSSPTEGRFSPARVKREALAAERRKPARAFAEPVVATWGAAGARGAASDEDVATAALGEEPAEPPASLDEACASDWLLISGVPADVFAHRVEQGQFVLSMPCREAALKAPEMRQDANFVLHCSGPEALAPDAAPFCTARAEAFRTFAMGRARGSDAADGAAAFADASTPAMRDRIEKNLSHPERQTEESLDATIAMADEITERDADARAAYEAKLVGLLLKEVHYGADIADDEYADLMDELNAFELAAEAPQAEEWRAFREDSQQRLAELASEREAVAAERAELRNELAARLDEQAAVDAEAPQEATGGEARSSADLQALMAEDRLLESEQQALWQEERSLRQGIAQAILAEREAVDSQLVRIPFVRLLAKGNLAELFSESADYIAENPVSPLGYYFKAQAEWRMGDRGAARATLGEAVAQGAGDSSLQELFERDVGREPSAYVDDLARSVGSSLGRGL